MALRTATNSAPPVRIEVREDAPQFYGEIAAFLRYRGAEAVLAGPYQTGKTYAALYKLHTLLSLYPNARALMVRKTYKSALGSAVVTYEKKVLPVPPDDPACPVERYGGEKVEHYTYPNGARLVVGGLDNPDKFLSAEYDFIYANQAEELLLDDWEKLTARANGRAGNAPWTQVMADCNPGPPGHWLLSRPRLKMFNTVHEDNPTLFDHAGGGWTAQGRKALEVLDALTGLRYKRGRLGLWVGAEGAVYDFDQAVHLVDAFPIPADWRRVRVIDFGYTNPFVCQWWAIDHDGRMYLYREMYMTKRTVRAHAEQIKRLSEGESIEATVADHDAEDIATLREHGIHAVNADKRVLVGIGRVQERLRVQGDGKARLYILRGALAEEDADLRGRRLPTHTAAELPEYVYATGVDGKPNKEEPVKLNDHGCDALRYAAMYADGSGRVEYAPSIWN